MLRGRHILVGISGGIAAYKIPELIRLLRKAGAEVRVATTHHALEFVTELTLQTLSGYKVYSDVFAAINEHSTEHISLPDWADLMLIAPATANVLCKMAGGVADDALTTTFAAMRKPVVVAPAMNDKMYLSPATQAAMQRLSAWENILMLDCADGELACGTSGKGRMQEPEALVEAVEEALTPKTLLGKRVLITAGPTQERIDPVRYISNYSTGKMGYALAQACRRHGAEVVLVSGKTHIHTVLDFPRFEQAPRLRRIDVGSAQEMYEACVAEFLQADLAILSAAVADFSPNSISPVKIKKRNDEDTLTLTLQKTPDIAATLGQQKSKGQRLVGFALETNDEEAHALHKLRSKGLDMIVLNSLRTPNACFGYDTNEVTVYRTVPLSSGQESDSSASSLPQESTIVAEGITKTTYPLQDKSLIAEDIITEAEQLF